MENVVEEEIEDALSARLAAPIGPLTSPVIKGWRGLAHYRTWSQRQVLQKSSGERTASDLYLLEELVTNVKFICDLPLSKRLEVCKVVGYERHDPNSKVCKQGQKGNIFYIVFTGSLKAIVHAQGVQDDAITVINAGQWFGDMALESENFIREATCITREKSELLTLSKHDYESILNIQKTAELTERVQFLQSIATFQNVSKQSLTRLANVLTHRSFGKNRVITFQGDDAVEMYFIKSGECRVIMKIHEERTFRRLPRASSFLSQYWPTKHHHCKQEMEEREREWWHPSLVKRLSVEKPRTSRILRSQSLPFTRLPLRLGPALLRSPDMINQLVVRKRSPSRARRSLAGIRRSTSSFSSFLPAKGRSMSSFRRHSSVPGIRRKSSKKHSLPADLTGDLLSAWGSPKGSSEVLVRSGTQEHRESSFVGGLPVSMASGSLGSKSWSLSNAEEEAVTTRAHFDSRKHASFHCSREEMPQKQKYSLGLFLTECEKKQKAQKLAEMEFSEKDNLLWQIGSMREGIMPAVLGQENVYYQKKFQRWAHNVINREKILLSYNVFAGTSAPSFMPGISDSTVMRLVRDKSDQKKSTARKSAKPAKASTILDIGALNPGQFFGERGLMTHTKRAASIVAVTRVDTLVLTKWDYHRHCDRNIIKVLSQNEYKKEKHLYKEYLKTCKWERHKRKVVEDALAAKKNRIAIRVGPREVRVLPRPGASKKELPRKEWLW